MTVDEYLISILKKYEVNNAGAKAAGNLIYPIIKKWGGDSLLSAEFSGSLAKGTAVSIGSDADIFLSLSSSVNETLESIYDTLYNALTSAGYIARKQNVSIGVTSNGYSIDLVPGRRISQYGNDHSLYVRKLQSWKKADVKKHIAFVQDSNRLNEIRLLKIWRQLHNLEFPSFFLEMAVIDALAYARYGELENNFLKCLNFLKDNIKTVNYTDPANTNNCISDLCTATEKSAIANQAYNSLSQRNWESVVW
ncbi:MAG TPA: nucleotidyltransferase [Methylophilaceae bacterium]|nr:nucleotidyltransferase [Methylophilaceae bacterium]HAJ71894.1 nucleotidyltransferase [Methylophilaceae bacterium]